MSNIVSTILIILLILIIIILTPLLLDLLFSYTVRSNRANQVLQLARVKSKKTDKPIIVFNNAASGVVIDTDGTISQEFKTDIVEAVNQMKDNSSILIVSQALEYIEPIELPKTIEQMRKVSGGDLYILGIERSAPRTIWDFKLKTLFNEPFYLPDQRISWLPMNQFQISLQQFYAYVFKVVPYDLFAPKSVINGSASTAVSPSI